MITLIGTHSYTSPLYINGETPSWFQSCKRHRFYVGITVLIGIVGLNIAICCRSSHSLASFFKKREALITYITIGCDYVAYTIFLVNNIKSPAASGDYETILDQFLQGSLPITVIRINNESNETLAIPVQNGAVCMFQDLFQWVYRENDPRVFGKYQNNSDMLMVDEAVMATALKHYTDSGHGRMNKLLRFSHLDDERDEVLVRKTVRTILCASAQLCAQSVYNGTTYRTARFEEDTIKNLYKEGSVITEQGFFSTGTDGGHGLGVGPILVEFTVHGKTGRDVRGISSHRAENEILFMPFTRFKVLRVIPGNPYKITLEEVYSPLN